MKNYPLAIACINVAAVLTETLGFGDAGSHSAGCLANATTTYVHLIGQSVAHSPPSSGSRIDRTVSVTAPRSLASYTSWDEIVGDADNHVFEDIFCLLFPVLDALFVDMGAVRPAERASWWSSAGTRIEATDTHVRLTCTCD